MSCSRRDCEKIMCDTYVDGIGYVCNECQLEFKESHGVLLSEREIFKALKDFMQTEKNSSQNREMSINEFFSH